MSLQLIATIVDRAALVRGEEWDGCLAGCPDGDDQPHLTHRFQSILEASGAIGGDTGWHPNHWALRDAEGRLAAILPLYRKDHSFGEFVDDRSWAKAFDDAGGRYYPKLLAAPPFMPLVGSRLLRRQGLPAATMPALFARLAGRCDGWQASGLHIHFPNEDEEAALAASGFLMRPDIQFEWSNPGYRDLPDFMADLKANRRNDIRRQRQRVRDQGVHIECLTGGETREEHWQAFHLLYRQTFERKNGVAPLPLAFFVELARTCPDAVLLVMARQGTAWVGGCFSLVGARTLYIRNWCGRDDIDALHFEVTYHQAMEFAMRRGLARVNAGTGGEYKVQRGFLPVRTWSAHHFVHPAMQTAVRRHLAGRLPAAEEYFAALAAKSPFRNQARVAAA